MLHTIVPLYVIVGIESSCREEGYIGGAACATGIGV